MSARAARLLAAACLLLALPACERTDDAPTREPPAVSTSATSGPATIAVDVDATDVRTVDRVTVTITASAEQGVLLAPPRIDTADTGWADAGWTVVARTDEPLDATDAGPVRRARVVLEPFLEGEYEVPPIAVAWSRPDGTAGAVASEPVAVTVRSVLGDDDPAQVSEARGLADPPPPEPEDAGVPGYALAGAAALLAAVGVLGWWLARRPTSVEAESPADRLARLARDPSTGADELCAAVAGALRAGGERPEPALALIDEAERVRYGRASITPERAHAMAAAALDLLAEPRGRGPA